MKLPRRVHVSSVVQARYAPGARPISWDERRAGIEKICTKDGESLLLFSNGGQSSPAPGWEILLTKQTETEGASAFEWTLYGIT